MLVTVEGFGSIWSKRVHAGGIAYYNTTGIRTNGQLHHRSRIFGQLRFNGIGGFNEQLDRNIGRLFQCVGDLASGPPKILFHHLAEKPATPDYFLFALTSDRTGGLRIGAGDWKSANVLLFGLSEFRDQQEAIVLIPPRGRLRGALGWFVAESCTDRPWRGFLRLIG
jgi:hypothetical protein